MAIPCQPLNNWSNGVGLLKQAWFGERRLCRCSITQNSYKAILKENLFKFVENREFIFQQDMVPPHTTTMVSNAANYYH